jgi:hypothetical protein
MNATDGLRFSGYTVLLSEIPPQARSGGHRNKGQGFFTQAYNKTLQVGPGRAVIATYRPVATSEFGVVELHGRFVNWKRGFLKSNPDSDASRFKMSIRRSKYKSIIYFWMDYTHENDVDD